MLESSFHSSLRWFHVGSIHPPQPYAATCRLPQQWAREEPAGKHSHGIPCKLVSEKKKLKHNEDRWKIWGPKPHRKPDPDAHRKHEPCQILWGLPSLAGRFGAHEHLLTDMVVPNKSVHFRCDPWNDKVFFLWLTSSFAIFHKETRKWPCVFINFFQFKYLI